MSNKPRDYAITITVRNNRMLEQMQLLGFESAAALHRASGVSMGTIGEFLRFKRAPIKRNEQWSVSLLKIAECLRCLPEDLFPPVHFRKPLEKSSAEFKTDAADINQISASLRSMALPADEKMMIVESKQALEGLMHGLSPREERVLRMRFGLDGREYTLEEIARPWGLTRDRIRQIEANAIRKLKRATFADRSFQETIGRRMPRSALGLTTVSYIQPRSYSQSGHTTPVNDDTRKIMSADERAANVKTLLEKYLGGPGTGSPNPYALQ